MICIHSITKESANNCISLWHRHNDPVPQMQITFCLGIYADYKGYQLVGVVIVGEPCGRFNSKQILEIRRVCFRPDFDHKRLKRYYHFDDFQHEFRPKNPYTLRSIPVVYFNGEGNPIFYNATTPYKFPSLVLNSVEFYVDKFFKHKNVEKLCTYIQDKENGRYITEAGYYHDKTFTRRGVKKRRFMKEVA